jgi:hypothetical protein
MFAVVVGIGIARRFDLDIWLAKLGLSGRNSILYLRYLGPGDLHHHNLEFSKLSWLDVASGNEASCESSFRVPEPTVIISISCEQT